MSDQLAIVPLLWDALGAGERREFRAVSREARAAADKLLDHFRINDFNMLLPQHEAEMAVARFLQRGGRPRKLVLRLNGKERRPEDMASIGLAALASFAGQLQLSGRPCLEALSLQGVPLTPEVARAITAAAPTLRSLKLSLYDLSTAVEGAAASTAAEGAAASTAAEGAATSTAAEGAAARTDLRAVTGLLRLLSPHLQRLSLEAASSWAPELGAALLQCTRLTAVSLCHSAGEGVTHLLGPLAQLPLLSSLKLLGPDRTGPSQFDFSRRRGDPFSSWAPASPARSAATIEALGRLTGLTRLVTRGRATLAFLPALPRLRALAELHARDVELTLGELAQLSQLSPLTRLTALTLINTAAQPGLIDSPERPRPAAGSARLPPALRSLELSRCVEPAVLLALRLPPSLARLQLPGLALPMIRQDLVERRHEAMIQAELEAFQSAVRQACVACGLLVGRLDELLLEAPFIVDLHIGSSDAFRMPQSGYRPLFAALRPLGLRRLDLRAPRMDARDMEALVQVLPGLEELHLDGVSACGALGRLRRLKQLRLVFAEPPTLEDLLQLCGSAPSGLRRLTLLARLDHRGFALAPGAAKEAQDALHAVMEALEVKLSQQGPVAGWAKRGDNEFVRSA